MGCALQPGVLAEGRANHKIALPSFLDGTSTRQVGAADHTQPSRWLDSQTFECVQSDRDREPQELTRLQRRGNEMVVVEHWLSEAERAHRETEARAEAAQDAWRERFRSGDPMYLRLAERVRALKLPGDTLDWRPSESRIVQYFREPGASADLRWDVEARTLKLQLYNPAGDCDRELTFEHSVKGIDDLVEAIALVFRRTS